MVARIGLLGGECTGKSSLAAALADALPACVAAEQVRGFVERHGRPPRPEEQAAVMQAQADAVRAAAAGCPHAVVIADPEPLMTAVYSEVYFGDRSLIAAGAALADACALLVWCDDDLPWTPDGAMRDGEAYRTAAQDVIARIVAEELAASGERVIRVTGPLEARTGAVLQAWQTMGPPRPT